MLHQIARCQTELALLEPQQADAHLGRAGATAEKLYKLPNNGGEYYFMAVGGIAVAVGDWENAVKMFRSATEASPKNNVALAGLLRALLHRGKEGDFDEALKVYEKIDEHDPFSTFDYGMIFFEQGDFEKAWLAWEPFRRGAYTLGAMKSLGELDRYHNYSLQAALALRHMPEAWSDLQWQLSEKAIDPAKTADLLFRRMAGHEDYKGLAAILGHEPSTLRDEVIPLVRKLEDLLRAASRTSELEALSTYDDYAAKQAKSEWTSAWKSTVLSLSKLEKVLWIHSSVWHGSF